MRPTLQLFPCVAKIPCVSSADGEVRDSQGQAGQGLHGVHAFHVRMNGDSPEPAHVLWLLWGWAALRSLGRWHRHRGVTLLPALEGAGFPLLLSTLVPPMPACGGSGGES